MSVIQSYFGKFKRSDDVTHQVLKKVFSDFVACGFIGKERMLI
jgi:hypothetical protein